MTFLEKLTIVMGVLMSLGYYPQAWRIFRTRSAEDISLWSVGIFALGMTTWLLYGVASGRLLVAGGFFFAALGSWLVFGLTLAYREDDSDIANENIG